MDPPSRPFGGRKSASAQFDRSSAADEISPNPFTSTSLSSPEGIMGKNGQSQSQIFLGENEAYMLGRQSSRLQIELSECVETKTVTTTTTTKRAYPPLIVRPPGPINKLDAKEYPLATKPTPQELRSFSYEIDGQVISLQEEESRGDAQLSASSGHSNPKSGRRPRSAIDFSLRTPNPNRSASHAARLESSTSSPSLNRTTSKSTNKSVAGNAMSKLKIDDEPTVFARSPLPRTKKKYGELQHPQTRSAHILGPNTPDASQLESTPNLDSKDLDLSNQEASPAPSRLPSRSSFMDAPSPPSEALPSMSFNGAVATPPIVETDLEPFEAVSARLSASTPLRSFYDSAVAQNASLPSPSLSPTMAAAQLHNGASNSDEEVETTDLSGDSQNEHTSMSKKLEKFETNGSLASIAENDSARVPTVLDTQSMLATFDAMPTDMKSFMMYQFLRRCSRKTLHMVVDVVRPALQCDFLDLLPTELGLNVLSFLDHKDLCCAAQVSKKWRDIIDTNETGWKELLVKNNYNLPEGELERAIAEGWGWQDPSGPDGYERDISNLDGETIQQLDAEPALQKMGLSAARAAKRKRQGSQSLGTSSKRRVVPTIKMAEFMKYKMYKGRNVEPGAMHKSEGPMSAANAAALAVPNPEVGLPSLRKLHLYKSLYRRHHMLKRSWTSGQIKPYHMAFAAHPRHVITCLQFDDDKILTGSDDTFIHVYDTKTGALRKKLEGHEGGVWALAYEGNVLVSGSTDRTVRVWDIEKGICTQVFHGHTSTVRCLTILMPVLAGTTFSGKPIMVPEKPLVITGSRDSHLRVWKLPEPGTNEYTRTNSATNDTDCPYFVRTLTGHQHSVRAIAAHQDTLVSGSYDCTVRVWKISTGETVHRLQGHSQKVYSVVLDNKRNRCISGSMDNYVKIWSLDTGACLYTLEGHNSLVGLLDLRDERLVSAAADSTLRIWDPENGQCKHTLTAHTGAITCFQHDNMKVISGSDRTLKMWNVKTGECIQDLLTDLSGVWQVRFDERRCVAAVQRDNLTYIEILDFGASRDGVSAKRLGKRNLIRDTRSRGISPETVDAITTT